MKDPNRPFKKWILNRDMGFGPIYNYSELEVALEEAWDESAKQLEKDVSYSPGDDIFNNKTLFLIGMENIKNACQDIMDTNGTTVSAKSNALALQIAAMNMSEIIMKDNFWKENKDG
jgi:hypothetical protein